MAIPPVNFTAKEIKQMRVVLRGQVVTGLLAGGLFDADDREAARKVAIVVSGALTDDIMAAEGIT